MDLDYFSPLQLHFCPITFYLKHNKRDLKIYINEEREKYEKCFFFLEFYSKIMNKNYFRLNNLFTIKKKNKVVRQNHYSNKNITFECKQMHLNSC